MTTRRTGRREAPVMATSGSTGSIQEVAVLLEVCTTPLDPLQQVPSRLLRDGLYEGFPSPTMRN
ncbi:unnamed protein product [Rhodiola kirilowii]